MAQPLIASSAAAKEIKVLIDDSVARVDDGARLVDQAGATMTEIVGSVERVAGIIGEITVATDEQTAGIGQINGAISFGHHAWDNAAGAALVLAAGGQISDLAGDPWTVDSPSILAAGPGVHDELVELISQLGDPRAFEVPKEKYR